MEVAPSRLLQTPQNRRIWVDNLPANHKNSEKNDNGQGAVLGVYAEGQ